MKDTYDKFFVIVDKIAIVAVIFLLGMSIGYEVGCSSKYHHTRYHNEHGETTCKICKELLEKGRK